jgi:acyl-CoA dehydrogenase
MASLIQDFLGELNAARALSPDAKAIRNAATEALTALRDATESVQRLAAEDMTRAQGVSVAYLKLCGVVLGGCLMARAAVVAEAALAATPDDAFYLGKLQTCRFYAEQVMPESAGLARTVKAGWGSVSEARSELL